MVCFLPANVSARWAPEKALPSGSGPRPANHGWASTCSVGIRPGALDACRELAEGGERVEAVGDVLYFWFPNGQGQSAIFKKATPRLLGMGTGRNWNTVLKLGEMVGLSPP